MPNTPSRLDTVYADVIERNELDTVDEGIWIVLIDVIRDYAREADYATWPELSDAIGESFPHGINVTD